MPSCAVPESADWIPSAEPPPWMVTTTPGVRFMYSSASFSANGWKAVEPARVRLSRGRPQPATKPAARNAARRLRRNGKQENGDRRCMASVCIMGI